MTRQLRRAWPFVPEPDGSSVTYDHDGKPRCGRVMRKYETVWGALLDEVVCGRPHGHTGRCRSVQAMNRNRERERERWPRERERRRERRVFERLPVADQLAVAVADAAEEARWQALGR